MKHLKKALYFLRLTDEDGLLSITHIACMVVLYKVATAPEPSIVDMGTLLITMSLYYGKRYINKGKTKVSNEQQEAINELKGKIQHLADKTSGMAAVIGMRNPVIKQ